MHASANRPPRRFLRRPFWRDWVLAYVLIGAGVLPTSPADPDTRWIGLVPGGVGVIIFLLAAGYAVWRKRS